MLVVLPFENLTAGDRYDYFSDGLTEEMITELACLSPEHGHFVVLRSLIWANTSRRVAGTNPARTRPANIKSFPR
jgi:TolB-like protein